MAACLVPPSQVLSFFFDIEDHVMRVLSVASLRRQPKVALPFQGAACPVAQSRRVACCGGNGYVEDVQPAAL